MLFRGDVSGKIYHPSRTLIYAGDILPNLPSIRAIKNPLPTVRFGWLPTMIGYPVLARYAISNIPNNRKQRKATMIIIILLMKKLRVIMRVICWFMGTLSTSRGYCLRYVVMHSQQYPRSSVGHTIWMFWMRHSYSLEKNGPPSILVSTCPSESEYESDLYPFALVFWIWLLYQN